MSQGQKPAANRSTLLQYKARIVGAKKGYALLKKKRDALKTRFQAMLMVGMVFGLVDAHIDGDRHSRICNKLGFGDAL